MTGLNVFRRWRSLVLPAHATDSAVVGLQTLVQNPRLGSSPRLVPVFTLRPEKRESSLMVRARELILVF